jgi:hypothetical protein
MAESVYILCGITSLLCTILLIRGYLSSRSRLLLWGSVAFLFLAANNILLSIDMIIFPDVDIQGPFWRNLLSAGSGSILLFGLIWEVS